MTRSFAAPRRLVFEAFTRPEHVRRWYGAGRAEMLRCEIDLRPGGAWRYELRAENGFEFAFCGEYLEVDPPARLVQTEVFDVPEWRSQPATVTVTFEESDGRTIMTSHVLHQTAEGRDAHLSSGMEEGAGESLDKLAELLKELA